MLELTLCIVAAARLGHLAVAAPTYVGKALRAGAEDPDIAAAYGVDHKKLAYLLSGIGAAYAGIAGTFIALIATLAPAQIWAYLGVVFAVVIIGRLGNPLGALLAGHADRRQRIARHGGAQPGLGAGRVVLGADRDPAVGSGMAMNAGRDLPKPGWPRHRRAGVPADGAAAGLLRILSSISSSSGSRCRPAGRC